MTGDSDWAGRGYTRPGPQGQDLGLVQVDADRQFAAMEYDDRPSTWRDCQREGDREREAG
jgi:hypothetical protein